MRRWAKAQLVQRARRAALFPPDLFADPCWDILIELLVAELNGRPVTTGHLTLAAGVPVTTALRRLGELEARGYLHRYKDAADWRRNNVRLTAQGGEALRQYFLSCQPPDKDRSVRGAA